jgi:hypothetical protein
LSDGHRAPRSRRAALTVALVALAFAAGHALDRLARRAPAPVAAAKPGIAPRDKDDEHSYVSRANDDDERAGQRAADAGEPAATMTLDEAAQRRAGIAAHTVPVRRVAQTRRGIASVVDLQPMIELADALATARTQLAAGRARLDAARSAYERARASSSAGAFSAAQVEAAAANFKSEQAAADAAAAHAETLAASASWAWGAVLGRALVRSGDPIARLLDRRDTLLQVSMPQAERLGAAAPRAATLQLDADQRVPLRFVSWAPKADPRLPGASMLFATASRDALVPGATWPVDVPLANDVRGGIVPTSAVVWSQGRAWYFKRSGETRFERHPLGDHAVRIDAGFVVPEVDDDDEIVVQGAQTLLSEEQRSKIELDETGGR